MFSFVLLDESVSPSRIIAARDPIGITTLYQGWSSKRPGATYFASELKALIDECDEIISFPPGHVYDSADKSTTRYFQPSWWDGDLEGPEAVIPTTPADLTLLRESLEAAVRKRLMSEVPYGVLLSGGLDSSLIASIAARETEKVAQAQREMRAKKLRELQSGPASPVNGGEIDEYGASISRNMTTRNVLILIHAPALQPPSHLGLSCTRSPLVSKTLLICWLHGKRRTSLAPSTTNTFSPCKKASTRSPTLSITSRHMMSRPSAPVRPCTSLAARSRLWVSRWSCPARVAMRSSEVNND